MYHTRIRFAFALLSLLAAGSALGATWAVNSENDLRSALNPSSGAQDGDTISFGTDITLTSSDLPFVQRGVTIEGNSHVLHAGNHRGLFVGTPTSGTASAPTLTVAILDLTITGAKVTGANGVGGYQPIGGWVIGGGGGGAGLGGGLFVGATASVTLANVTLNNNSAVGGAGGDSGYYGGTNPSVDLTVAGDGGGWYGSNGGGTSYNNPAGPPRTWDGGAGGFGAGGGGGGGVDCGPIGQTVYDGPTGSANGGPGGFGGGGGGAGNGTGVSGNSPGAGGFGGGTGGDGGTDMNAGSYHPPTPMYRGGVGGGGAGLGGAIFVQQGGSLTVNGPVTINGNTVTGGVAPYNPAGGTATHNGAGLGAGIFLQGTDPKNVGGNCSLTFAPSDGQTVVVDGIADQNGNGGSWRLALTGAGKVILSGSNTLGGGITISKGSTLQIGAGGTVDSLQGNVTNDGLLVFNPSNGTTYSGVVSGSGILNQAGAGVLVLNGASTYTGGTRISAGTLQIGSGGATGSIPAAGPIDNYSSLAFALTSNTTCAGIIRGPGTLTQEGTGILSLTGSNSYSGATFVNAGTLLVNNTAGSATGSGTVTVAASATIGGNGMIGGSLAAGDGAIVAPGTANPGTPFLAGVLRVGGDVTLNGSVKATYWVGPPGTATLAVGGAFLKSTASPTRVLITIGGLLRPGQLYTLATFRSTNFQPGDFVANLPGVFVVLPNSLVFRLP